VYFIPDELRSTHTERARNHSQHFLGNP
jgi:hypothetical protein